MRVCSSLLAEDDQSLPMKQVLTEAVVGACSQALGSPQGHRRRPLTVPFIPVGNRFWREAALSIFSIYIAAVTVPSLLVLCFISSFMWCPFLADSCHHLSHAERTEEQTILTLHRLSHKVFSALLRSFATAATQAGARAQTWKKVLQSALKWKFTCRSCIASADPALLNLYVTTHRNTAYKCWGGFPIVVG